MPRVQPGQRKRAYAPKSHHGCLTCKIRRVKCDETKPFCIKCSNTGRKCDGYDSDKQTLSIAHPNAILTPSLARSVNWRILEDERERRSFHFFCVRSVSQLCGFNGSDFWESLVLRAAHSDRGIRHGLVALGSLYERFQNRHLAERQFDETDEQVNFALQQYNIAIAEYVTPYESHHELRSDAYLASCIIFICIETLRGHMGSAIALIRNGLSLLRHLMSTADANEFQKQNLAFPSAPYFPLSSLKTIFVRLETQVLVLVRRSNWQFSPRVDGPEEFLPRKGRFRSIIDARDCLEYYWLEYERALHEIKAGDTVNVALMARLNTQYIELYKLWSSALTSLIEYRGITLTTNERKAIAILQIQRLMLLKSVTLYEVDNDQMVYDDYTSIFQELVSCAAVAMDLPLECFGTPIAAYVPSFSLEIGIVGPLFDTAIQCRDPIVRRQAVWLLEITSRQEGIWDGVVGAKIAARVIAIEEEGLESVTSCKDISASARISRVEPVYDPEGRRAVIHYSRPMAAGRDEERLEDVMNL